MLNFVSITGMNTILPVAQYLLSGEAEGDFVWAFNVLQLLMIKYDTPMPNVILTDRAEAGINAVKNVFPNLEHIICHWHVNRNVLSKVRIELGQVPVANPATNQPKYENSVAIDTFMAAFHREVSAKSETVYEKNLVEIRRQSPTIANYLDRHWRRFKSLIVHCWTDQIAHFGIRDTSSVEGTHTKVKRLLDFSRRDLFTLFAKVLPWWESNARDHSLLVQRNLTITPHKLQGNQYASVVRIITNYALSETDKLWRDPSNIVYNNRPRSVCDGTFRYVNGRPYLHEIIAIIESNGARYLVPNDFDQHWRIRRGVNEHAPDFKRQQAWVVDVYQEQQRRLAELMMVPPVPEGSRLCMSELIAITQQDPLSAWPDLSSTFKFTGHIQEITPNTKKIIIMKPKFLPEAGGMLIFINWCTLSRRMRILIGIMHDFAS